MRAASHLLTICWEACLLPCCASVASSCNDIMSSLRYGSRCSVSFIQCHQSLRSFLFSVKWHLLVCSHTRGPYTFGTVLGWGNRKRTRKQ